jgi:hypothetical protein
MKSSERKANALGNSTGSQKPFDMFTPIIGGFPLFFKHCLTVNFWEFLVVVIFNMHQKCTNGYQPRVIFGQKLVQLGRFELPTS